MLEEIGNAVTHGTGALLAVVGIILLLLKSNTGLKLMASLFYGISLFVPAELVSDEFSVVLLDFNWRIWVYHWNDSFCKKEEI